MSDKPEKPNPNDPKNWTARDHIIEATVYAIMFGLMIVVSREYGSDVGAWIFGLFG